MKRSYGQYCGVARALDLVGERWTLLVVRELIVGPQRYKDLLEALPGIGTNLLAARLRELEDAGIVARRKLPPPAASQVYELTDFGRELDPIVTALGRWGRKRLEPEPGDDVFVGRWLLFALHTNFAPEQAAGVRETYELRCDDVVLHARVEDGKLTLGQGQAEAPDVVLETGLQDLFALARGDLTPAAAIRAGRLRTSGGRAAFDRFWKVFDGPSLAAAQLWIS
jgi:DNA-binding HxlR family transcriptional regulator